MCWRIALKGVTISTLDIAAPTSVPARWIHIQGCAESRVGVRHVLGGETKEVRLSELGFGQLDDFSEQVWRTVARHPYCAVDQLAEWLRRPEAEVQAEIDRLVECGLLRQVGHQWEPQDPVRVLQERHAEREAALNAERARMAAERVKLYRSGLFGDYIAGRRRAGTHDGVQVHHREEIYPRMAESTAQSTERIRFLLTGLQPPGLTGDVADLLVPAAARGLEVSSVWTPEAVAAARRRRNGRRLPPLGQIHITPAVPTRVIVWDDRAALIPIRDDALDEGAFFVVAPTLVMAVADMVTRIQQEAQQRPPQVEGIDEPEAIRRQRALVILLDRGYDDARAARELCVSPRTVKRDVERLYEKWGVTSRFALGAAAVRAGWLGRSEVGPFGTRRPEKAS